MGLVLVRLLAISLAGCDARLWGGRDVTARGDGTSAVTPRVVRASHNVAGYGPECAADERDDTCAHRGSERGRSLRGEAPRVVAVA